MTGNTSGFLKVTQCLLVVKNQRLWGWGDGPAATVLAVQP